MNQNTFSTSELPLAALLLYKGYKLTIVDKHNPRSVFIFEQSEQLDQSVQEFWANEARVEPLAFFNSIKAIKSRIYQQNERPNSQ